MSNNYVKMSGLLVPYQNKGGGSYNLEFPVRQNPMTNDRYLGGVSIILDFGVEGMNVARGASIVLSKNSQYESIRNKLKEYFADKPTQNWFTVDDSNAVKVMFDFAGCSDSYSDKNDTNYQNVHIENIELVQ
mgnify:CR=1 FL=1|tara:strand:+ start:343 stop:738 length:396 start_codon:yes stop_codon:yes gene_type:complete